MKQLPQESKPLWMYLIQRGMTIEQADFICWRDAGYSWQEIAELYQVSTRTVTRWLTELKADI